MNRCRIAPLLALLTGLAAHSAWADTCTYFPDPGGPPSHFNLEPGMEPGMEPGQEPRMDPRLRGWPGRQQEPRPTGPASARISGFVRQISEVLGAPAVPVFQGNVPNAAATPGGILYNARFLQSLERRAGRLGVVSVLAHEVGHKVNRDDSFFTGLTHPWDKELRADHISGYVVAKLGGSLKAATAALRSLYQPYAGPTHPSTPMRIPAVEAGWRQAQAEGRGTVASRTPPDRGAVASRSPQDRAAPERSRSFPSAPPGIDLEDRRGLELPAPTPAPRVRARSRNVVRVVALPCEHAAHPFDVRVMVVAGAYGWQEIHERVPCQHVAHRAHRVRVIARNLSPREDWPTRVEPPTQPERREQPPSSRFPLEDSL